VTRGVVCKGVLLASFSEQYARSLAWGSATENTCSGSDPLILRLVFNAKLDRSSFELGYSFDSCPQSYDPTNRKNVGWFNAQRKWNELKIVDWSLSLAPWGGLMIANVCPHVGGGCLSLTLAPMRIKRIATDQLYAPHIPWHTWIGKGNNFDYNRFQKPPHSWGFIHSPEVRRLGAEPL